MKPAEADFQQLILAMFALIVENVRNALQQLFLESKGSDSIEKLILIRSCLLTYFFNRV